MDLPYPFDDVVIHLVQAKSYREANVFYARVVNSPRPLNGSAFRFDVEAQLKAFRKKFRQIIDFGRGVYDYDAPSKSQSQLVTLMGQKMAPLGKELYEVLPTSLQEGFPPLIQASLNKGRGIRLVIEAEAKDKAAPLLSLPWELLFVQEEHAYLAYSPRLLIVRRLLGAISQQSLVKPSDYQLLHLVADDPNQPPKALAEFEVLRKMEGEVLPQALRGQYTRVQAPGSVKQMQAALDKGAYHILHVLGHGTFINIDTPSVPPSSGIRIEPGQAQGDAPTERGSLFFVEQEGEREYVTGEQLQRHLASSSTVQLAVLNACHSGSAAASNVAQELVYSGLPVVVAMQAKIDMRAAKLFIKAFYEALAEGYPYEYAMAMGRVKIVTELPGAPDWALPVLYTNVGLPDPPRFTQFIERLWQWFSQKARHVIPPASLALGSFLLIVGLFLQFNQITYQLPNLSFLAQVTAWSVALPPLIASTVYLAPPMPIPQSWLLPTRTALALRLFAAASIGLGISYFFLLWIGLTLLLSLGLWNLLPAIAQFLLLIPLLFLSLLVSVAQTIGFSRAFIQEAKLEMPDIVWGDLTVALAGYIMMFLPLALWLIFPSLMAPPLGTLLVGILLLGIGMASRTSC